MPFVAGNIYWITYSYIFPIHEKISLCVCPERPLFFWINSNAKVHGVGQLALSQALCPQLHHDSFLDLSGLKTGSEADLQTARDDGPMSEAMKTQVLLELSTPIRLLTEAHRALALGNLT
jgi:hypothetical protein